MNCIHWTLQNGHFIDKFFGVENISQDVFFNCEISKENIKEYLINKYGDRRSKKCKCFYFCLDEIYKDCIYFYEEYNATNKRIVEFNLLFISIPPEIYNIIISYLFPS